MKAEFEHNNLDQRSGRPLPKADSSQKVRSIAGTSIVRSRLFVKYVALLVTVVVLALVANGAFEVWFSYQEHKATLIATQRLQAQAAADKIEEFITQIDSQVGWTTQLPWTDGTLDQRRFDALRLLRQVPAITELAQIDATGHEQLKVSRLTMDVVGSGIDYSAKPEFKQAVTNKVYYGPVYFRRESEPYMTIALAGARRDSGVSIAQVNLKLIWDVVSKIKVGINGRAYVVDGDGRLIAHPDISLVLRNTDMNRLPQIESARAGSGGDAVREAFDVAGHKVLTAFALVNPLGWFVFVETPIAEAYAPLYASIQRTGYVLFGALALAFIAGIFLAGRMVVPIQALRAGAARIGSGDLGQRINIKTGDEVEALANQFNAMAGQLQESYADLEKKVELRTHELSEALEQQTATSEVLKIISRSTFDLQTVLDTLVESAARLCEADVAVMNRLEGSDYHVASSHGLSHDQRAAIANIPIPVGRGTITGRAAQEGKIVHVCDIMADSEFLMKDWYRTVGSRTMLGVPLLREGTPVGVIVLMRRIVRPFTEKQIELAQTFADQAVIAIENVRLFKAEQERTAELSESLQQQTATAEILSSISSSMADAKPVFDAIASNLLRLFGTRFAVVTLVRDNFLEMVGIKGEAGFERLAEHYPVPLDGSTHVAKAVLAGQTMQLVPIIGNPDAPPGTAEFAREFGYNAQIATPMMREGKAIGAIVTAKRDAAPFTAKQAALIKSFADQAVIAIENARLLTELRQRTEDLSESLEQQTAISEILRVISNSPDDVQPVLNSVAEHAARICEASYVDIILVEDGVGRDRANFGGLAAMPPSEGIPLDRFSVAGRSICDMVPVQVEDQQNVGDDFARGREYARRFGHRTILGVPLLREGHALGTIMVRRTEVRPFEQKHIALLTTFADQAAIAIENVRLFKAEQQRTRELSESLEQQTATAEVLRVISASPGDLQPVFNAMLENATRICGAKFGLMFLSEGGAGYRTVAMYGAPEEFVQVRSRSLTVAPNPGTTLGRVAATKEPFQIADVQAEPAYTQDPNRADFLRMTGARTVLNVPMLKDDGVVGQIAIYRQEIQPFTDKQVSLLTNFAAQAVIAIENARLLSELRQRTEELSASLHDLRTAQDRLVQTEKLASLGQLTAGIAHEIKNPLNFVNNFSSLSVELVQELNDIVATLKTDDKTRNEINELAETLRGNLEKIVQHGKRADSIVKNMLLHSREGSGEHRPVDINGLVEESLNLAYHGARAEKQGFNITLERAFDPAAGAVDLYPQEITRVLLNLISNGFYAATKRKAQAGDGFEPVLLASTKNLGDRVEIRIRDNGTGIPPEVKAKIFNPFFTTKPAGEGTGLGLSISHDIIVKQHAGSIVVDTAAEQFTEFKIVLPRTAASIAKPGGRA